MPIEEMSEPLAVDRRFFACLLAADGEGLDEVLAEDFVLVDVMRGAEVPRGALVDAVSSRQLRFEAIDVLESRERRYGDAGVVTGRTEMRGRAGDQVWAVKSRYTHVYAVIDGRFRLVSAQGTPVAE